MVRVASDRRDLADRDPAQQGRPSEQARSALLGRGVAGAVGLQRTVGNRATATLLQRNNVKSKAKKIKNPRLREAFKELEKTYTLPAERTGSKKKSQRLKHEQEYADEMRKFARRILIDSEGHVSVGGHAKGRHGGVTDTFLMERRIPVASAFDSIEDQEVAVTALLIANRDELESWRDESDEPQFGLTIERPEDAHVHGMERIPGVGPGFNRLDEAQFPYVKAFFRKDDMSAMNPWGLITCYPSRDP